MDCLRFVFFREVNGQKFKIGFLQGNAFKKCDFSKEFFKVFSIKYFFYFGFYRLFWN